MPQISSQELDVGVAPARNLLIHPGEEYNPAQQVFGMNLLARWKAAWDSAENKGAGNPNQRWLAVSMAAVVLAVGLTGAILDYRWVRRLASPPTLGLQVRWEAGKFLVNWNRKAPDILRARRGVLVVRDGIYEHHLALDPLQLRSGSLTYTSAGADIRFRLDVFRDRDRSLSESIRVLAPKDTVRPGTGRMLAQAGARTDGMLASPPHRAKPEKPEARAATAAAPAAFGNPAVAQKSSLVSPPPGPGPARPYRAPRMARPPATTASYVGPQVIHQVEPVIPAELRASLASEVRIDVRVAIDVEGTVTDAEVTSASGVSQPSLASTALLAARQFRFQAAHWNDRSVPSAMILSFRLVR